ncbi:hypothetical protein PGT21_004932 [Puccinia graminis f. sp. tritici]|uniref:Carbohydrate kinase PfkB domain-containing protein n=2 Tax=Puccinia graminis f. sp. tritici TaxID=56615 RepID=E3K8K7_PUCGT|nr:uncharacterized protein PGTG_06572 [Puccinia graminis f. sp. tritici CRL 75-36-700-3]EFP80616.1 hypothetical protein PGTG_06572 [Puccinia graminis f. sp. tritici CRL 75-36-700-3]KAA1111576.1 hypothetical protein PGT21_004932 [Puccinia graminis f. sp. tritici]KAA1123830.1 hypothetical protein PGTUg99_024484 [Puccinia graminis f. sp. tritici]
MAAQPHVATLGMFILDSFKYEDDYCATQKPSLDPGEWYIGGGGTYATIGARIWLSPDRIAMIIHQGNDFPAKISEELGSYSPCLFTMISDPAHPKTTRALNTYTNDRREFAYLTPKRRVQLAEVYSAKSCPPGFLHLICSPERLVDLLAERKKRFPDWTPEWIWEPVPEACKPENLSQLLECAGQVAVFSPNELEASELLGHPNPPCSAEEIEAIAEHFHQAGFQAVVIRSGKRGSYVIGAHGPDHPVARFWVPALIEDQRLVLDQTGAGNSFLGGLMAGLARGESLLDATCYGAVSSGLTITQLGLPKITLRHDSEPASEIWNGDRSPPQLLAQIRQRVVVVPPK